MLCARMAALACLLFKLSTLRMNSKEKKKKKKKKHLTIKPVASFKIVQK